MAVREVGSKDQRNEEGLVDNSKQKDTIEITAYFDGAETAEAYFGLSSYLQYTRKELAKCCEIVQNGIDAVRLQTEYEKRAEMNYPSGKYKAIRNYVSI